MPGTARKDKAMLTPQRPAEKTSRSNKLESLAEHLKRECGVDELKLERPALPQEEPAPAKEKEEKTPEESFVLDLLWIYRQWGGKAQLLEEMRKDPDIRKLVLSTLLRSGLLAQPSTQGAKPGQKNNKKDAMGTPKRGFLLVMKGLHEKSIESGDGKQSNSPIESVNPLTQETILNEPLNDQDLRNEGLEEEITVEGLEDGAK